MSSGRYATETTVPVSKSRLEIEATLDRYGAESFGYDRFKHGVEIRFELQGLRVRLRMPLPIRDDKAFTVDTRGYNRSESAAERLWEQACRSRWRSLALLVKAKLEAIEIGILSIEEAFLSDVVTFTGETVGDRILPMVPHIVAGTVPLPLSPGTEDEGEYRELPD